MDWESFFHACAKYDRPGILTWVAKGFSWQSSCATEGHFRRLATSFLDLKRDDLSGREWKNLRNLLFSKNGPINYFGDSKVAEITTADLRKYLRFAEANATQGKLSPFTLRRHLSAVRGIIRLAAERRLISRPPPLPRIKARDAPRGWFRANEYRQLCSTAHNLGQRAVGDGDAEAAAEWHELGDLIAFLVNSFLRPGEWKHLRHRDIFVERAGSTPHLLISLQQSKTGVRAVASMPAGVKIYDRIVARSGADPSDFLFLNRYTNRQTAQDKFWRLFRLLLDRTGLRFDRDGRPRTLYSLRHTSLMLRLLNAEKLDLLTLARAGGTSVAMLERFYLSHHGPALKLAELQSFGGKSPKGSSTSGPIRKMQWPGEFTDYQDRSGQSVREQDVIGGKTSSKVRRPRSPPAADRNPLSDP